MSLDVARWRRLLSEKGSDKKAAGSQRFFQCGPGQYGEGDMFVGVTVPENRQISRTFYQLPLADIETMLHSEVHEYRLGALMALCERYKRYKDQSERDRIIELYVANVGYVNNWDLVDLSCDKLLGAEIAAGRHIDTLHRLAESDHLWSQRIAVVSTLYPLRKGDSRIAVEMATRFVGHTHHLMQKAVGWVMRETGKRERPTMIDFLERNIDRMSSVILSYIGEIMEPSEKKEWQTRRRQACRK